jgi:hypothetical protein
MTDHLVKRGFREDDIVKVLGGNFLRLLRAVLKPRASVSALGMPVAEAAVSSLKAAG